jgi:hypothetical protein
MDDDLENGEPSDDDKRVGSGLKQDNSEWKQL